MGIMQQWSKIRTPLLTAQEPVLKILVATYLENGSKKLGLFLNALEDIPVSRDTCQQIPWELSCQLAETNNQWRKPILSSSNLTRDFCPQKFMVSVFRMQNIQLLKHSISNLPSVIWSGKKTPNNKKTSQSFIYEINVNIFVSIHCNWDKLRKLV